MSPYHNLGVLVRGLWVVAERYFFSGIFISRVLGTMLGCD